MEHVCVVGDARPRKPIQHADDDERLLMHMERGTEHIRVNVLIYAHREDAPEHERYAEWLRHLTAADAPFALSDVVFSGLL